jgi:hypothetical protein
MDIVRKRGRPIGHKLGEATKERIRQKRVGTSHTEETKNKISKSLITYFKTKDKLSDSMEYEYSYVSGEATDWVAENRDAIDETECVMTEKRMSYLRQLEISIGNGIEDIFGHNATPEFYMLLKEEMKELRCAKSDMDELYSLI